uniref:Uncharacterized protein n=1 Tax=Elaeophora elaphi TaxID=1147741 RepID=A0A0R3RYI1_9BILA
MEFHDSKYWRQLKPYDDLKPRLRTNEGNMKSFPEGIELKFKYGIAKDQVRGNTFSKWIGPNGRLSTSRALTPSEETHYIKKAGKRMVEDKQGTETVAEQRSSKFVYSDFKSDSIPIDEPSRCPPLNPLVNSLPHDDTDKTCGQSLEGWTKDPQCACIYSVAERTDEGCPAKFYTLCYRLIDQSADYETKEFGPQVSKTSYGQNTETYSRREPIDHYDQRPVNDNKLKLNEKRGSERMEKIWLEDDKKVNQTVSVGLSAEESESKESESNESESKESKLKEDEAQSIIVNSTTQFLNMNELTRRDNETLESSEQI